MEDAEYGRIDDGSTAAKSTTPNSDVETRKIIFASGLLIFVSAAMGA